VFHVEQSLTLLYVQYCYYRDKETANKNRPPTVPTGGEFGNVPVLPHRVLQGLPIDLHPTIRALADFAADFKARFKLSPADAIHKTRLSFPELYFASEKSQPSAYKDPECRLGLTIAPPYQTS
jgi:hypothetical protein